MKPINDGKNSGGLYILVPSLCFSGEKVQVFYHALSEHG